LVQALRAKPYSLPYSDWPENLKREWDALFEHKTKVIVLPPEKRDSRARWNEMVDPTSGEKTCPTAEKVQILFSRLFGWMVLSDQAEDPCMRGLGLKVSDLSFASIVDIKLLVGYLEFKKNRVSNYNNGTIHFITVVSSLIHPENGFLTQDLSNKYSRKFESNNLGISWKSRCKVTHESLALLRKQILPHVVKTRDPGVQLRPLLEEESPILQLHTMNQVALAEFRDYVQGIKEVNHKAALAFRDLLMSSLLTSHPLRVKNLRWLNYSKDNAGQLRQRQDGSWWLDIPKEYFKNQKGAAKDMDYIVKVAGHLWPLIEEYIDKYRPLIAQTESDVFFVRSSKGQGKPCDVLSTMAIYDALRSYTAKYCPINMSEGFGPHGYRHIVATDYLKSHPYGVDVAAAVLHDKPETVRKEYAHLLNYDLYRHFNRHNMTSRNAALEMLEAA